MWPTRISPLVAILGILHYGALVSAINLDLSNTDSIKKAARIAADGMMSYYVGNQTGQWLGVLPEPYYWWEAGAMWGQMVEYWFYTGDSTYNDVTTQGLLAQVGDEKDFMPKNQTKTEVCSPVKIEPSKLPQETDMYDRETMIRHFGLSQPCRLQK